MATEHFFNAHVSINSVDLSDHVRSVTLNYEAESLDETAMGNTNRIHKAGLTNWTLTVNFFQDYAANEIDASLFSLVGAAAFPIAVRKDTGAIAADNPEYQGNAILTSYQPMGGTIGEMEMAPVTFQAASALTRDVTP